MTLNTMRSKVSHICYTVSQESKVSINFTLQPSFSSYRPYRDNCAEWLQMTLRWKGERNPIFILLVPSSSQFLLSSALWGEICNKIGIFYFPTQARMLNFKSFFQTTILTPKLPHTCDISPPPPPTHTHGSQILIILVLRPAIFKLHFGSNPESQNFGQS